MKAWLLFLVLAVLLVLGSVIEVRVLVLPFSVPVLLSVPSWFHSLTPVPQFLVWCCVERRGAPGCCCCWVGWGGRWLIGYCCCSFHTRAYSRPAVRL